MVRGQARDHPSEVAQRSGPKHVVLFPGDARNDEVAEGYDHKGWPPALPGVAPDGTLRMLQYVVLDLDAIEAGEAAQAVTRIAGGFGPNADPSAARG